MDKSNEMLLQLHAMMRDNPELVRQLQACKNATEVAQIITLIVKQGHIPSSDKAVDLVNMPALTEAQLESVTGGVSGEDVLMGFAKFFFVGVAAVANVVEVASPGKGRKLIQDVLDYKFTDER
jgi:hypothetical protein